MSTATHTESKKVFLVRGSDVSHIMQQIRAHRSADMTTETLLVSPDLAHYILDNHNTGNRNIRSKRVLELARAIKDGTWQLTSQGISFSRDGFLNNGQHRLAACIEADKHILIRVTWGEDREVFGVLDTGSLRGAADVLQSAGYVNVNELAAAARLKHYLQTGYASIRNDEAITILEDNPSIVAVGTMGSTASKKFRVSSAGVVYAFALIHSKSPRSAMLPDFYSMLMEGAMLPKYSPILALREGFVQKKFDAGIRMGLQRSEAIAACIIKAWNAWAVGADVKVLRFNRNSEKFPEVK